MHTTHVLTSLLHESFISRHPVRRIMQMKPQD